MIGWLKGEIQHRDQRRSRNLVLIGCGGIGYEVYLVQRDWQTLSTGKVHEFWIHQVVSADSLQLFGFLQVAERDLFRELIQVSGVGPQAGLSLLDACKPNELVRALVHSDINTLCRAKGVGKRTAERLALELRTRLVDSDGSIDPDLNQVDSVPPDLIATLETLGYETHEIQSALQRLSSIGGPQDGDDDDAWLRACIKLMSFLGP
ncbi:Holliday junction branch migration protein RuvA [Synechococcus sp. A15-24]|uniref:Holliday junction branch migration protein RuvA n=1 Tax=Synechococcus sp. A15-24 TaxID=1050635 RepID=UPI0016480C32|nr:Holliday junction branch migration protein RuvA [Synechococcus sp. A15-24]QNJ28806.1 holliday junction ATP-dependent DNA helicase RuvA [Synechococcus sp. A15-24]